MADALIDNEQYRAQRFLGGTGKLYKPSLDHLMSFSISGTEIARDYVYTDDKLCAIEPKHVLLWMNLRAFGTVNLGVDANPISARSSTLAYWKKKAISFFHPNRLMVWSAGRMEGNPTRSVEINNLIKQVKKKDEVRKQGVRSQTQLKRKTR